MSDETIVILGIPVDNLTMDMAVKRIFSMIDDFAVDGRARLVATVNVDFLVNAHAWFRKHIRHPELLDILRRADMVTADGMPIVWASKLLGTPLKERVTGADLVPRLAEEASKRKKTIFFLGGKGDVGQKASDLLKEWYPGFEVAGVYSPFVHVEGEAILDTEAADEEIVDRINQSKADILLLAFGNPKQEIWFERNRLRLKVPVSIGIGGTYEFIVGSVVRAPEWMQKSGTEWIFRMTQDPKRLIKRYLLGFFKLGFMLWPALLHYRYQLLRYKRLQPSRKDAQTAQVSTVSGDRDMKVINFPARVDASFVKQDGGKIENAIGEAAFMALDFSRTSFIDSSGLGLIVKLWKRGPETKTGIYFTGIHGGVVHFFKLTRLWDLFSKKAYDDLDHLLRNLDQEKLLPPFFMVVAEETPDVVVLSLTGRLDGVQMANIEMDAVIDNVGGRNCTFDLSGLEYVDGSGIFFFLKIQKALAQKGKTCALSNVSGNVLQIFRISKLEHLFDLATDVETAKQKLL
jgi:N-acetylglucosaminyldiphosphoundecaprenol N-acetyl-beta-D-mannosaminyltransferase